MMLTIEQAGSIIKENVQSLKSRNCNLLEALDKVLAEEIYAQENLPPFAKSAMDGYAIKSADTANCSAGSPVCLSVKGVIPAGEYCQESLSAGFAWKIMTGAPLPEGADAVIQIEKVETQGEQIYLREFVPLQSNVIAEGEEIRKDELALKKGHLIRPAEIGFLASLGYATLKVIPAPKVALLITGDELVGINEKLGLGKIRNSNEYSLSALLKKKEIDVISYGIIPDNKDILLKKMQTAFADADVVISSGGVSVGDYDFIEPILATIGAKIHFTSVAMKPGKPLTFATYKDKLFFGLPGNPAAVIATFEQFVSKALDMMMGKNELRKEKFAVILADDFKAKKGRRNYVYVYLEEKDGKLYAHKIGSQSSSQLMTMTKANGIIVIPEDRGNVKAGDVLDGKFIF